MIHVDDQYHDPEGHFSLYNGDSCEFSRTIPDETIDLSVFSTPFADLYTYSNSPRDLGNVRDYDEFFAHFAYLTKELFRITKPGRKVIVHCMDLPMMKGRHGIEGVYDFSGELTRHFVAHGFVMHCPRITIWKNPVTQMQRTKAHGLLHKTLRENADFTRTGIPDQLLVFRKPGECAREDRVVHDPNEFPVDLWQQWASPVWMDIDESDTLQYRDARENDDEKHLCPLQVPVAERAVLMWTNRGHRVYSPFMGIGTEGYAAVKHGRHFVGCELKPSYYRKAIENVTIAGSQRELTLVAPRSADGARRRRQTRAAR